MIDPQDWILDNKGGLISLEKWQKTVDLLAEFFAAPAAFLVQHTKGGYQVTIASQQTSNPYPAGIIIESEANIFCRKIVETGKPLYVANAIIDAYWDTNTEVHEDGFLSYLGVPVFWPDNTPFGTFCVMDYQETDYSTLFIKLIHQLKDILESDLALISAYEDMRGLALTDDLTKIHNRRGYRVLAEQRLKLARRMGIKVELLYLDINDFKTINDDYGHEIGDQVLIALADAMLASVRDSDIVGRLGGDEFTALVMVQEANDFEHIQNRIHKSLKSNIASRELPSVNVSIGYALAEEANIDELIAEADRKMYQQKHPRAPLNKSQ
jgi:diguanylate cyclase (GGDEF)-like protein